MSESDIDARIAELVAGLIRLRRDLDAATYGDLLGSMLVEVETGEELVIERRHRPRAHGGTVVPFPGSPTAPIRDGGNR